MKNYLLKAAVPALLLAAACGVTSAWAQDAAAPAATAPAAANPVAKAAAHAKKHEDMVEARIKSLHQQLAITDQQSSQWDAFAGTMRDNAKKTDDAFRDRAGKLGKASADDAMKSYAELAQLHADNMQKLATAFSSLYATLSDQQKETADLLFRNKAAKHHHHHHGAKPMAPAAASAPQG